MPGATLNPLNNCEATRTLARVTGSVTAQCAFTGVMINTGTGCAANVRGTTTAARDNAGTQQTGTAPWTYGAIVRPGEQFSYQLSTLLAIPSSGEFFGNRQPLGTTSAARKQGSRSLHDIAAISVDGRETIID